jgi:hypothetical protein
VLPYVDDFVFFASSEKEAMQVRDHLGKLFNPVGILRHPTKSFWEPTLFGHHLDINIDSATCYFCPRRQPTEDQHTCKTPIELATRNSR